MHDDEAYWRFFAWLNLFTFAMLMLVLGDNLLLMFVGWEGVGLCSYRADRLLVQGLANASAGNKAFIVNRIGDFGVPARRCSCCSGRCRMPGIRLGDLPRDRAVRARCSTASWFAACAVATFVTLLFFVGATGKSAQIPLYVWLPDAMAGPTPVSALIHAATMVTAGVYMVGAPELPVRDGAGHAGCRRRRSARCTALFAATIGIAQNDIKKVLAYSTVSQLGYMFIGDGRRRVRRRHLPPDDPRVLQGLPVPRLRLRHPRHGRRAGHAQDGRPAAQDADHVLDLPDRDARDRRHPAVRRLLVEGRDPLAGLSPSTAAR